MFKKPLSKYLVFLLVLLVFYLGQLILFKKLHINIAQRQTTIAYLINITVVILFFLFVDFFKNKFKNQIGFGFMLSGLLKFVLFFIFLYPVFNKDSVFSKQEMFAFFIPYSISLIYETLVVSKILNNLKF
jgi:hypothetical protein